LGQKPRRESGIGFLKAKEISGLTGNLGPLGQNIGIPREYAPPVEEQIPEG
jgi:hypothetical protein